MTEYTAIYDHVYAYDFSEVAYLKHSFESALQVHKEHCERVTVQYPCHAYCMCLMWGAWLNHTLHKIHIHIHTHNPTTTKHSIMKFWPLWKLWIIIDAIGIVSLIICFELLSINGLYIKKSQKSNDHSFSLSLYLDRYRDRYSGLKGC